MEKGYSLILFVACRPTVAVIRVKIERQLLLQCISPRVTVERQIKM